MIVFSTLVSDNFLVTMLRGSARRLINVLAKPVSKRTLRSLLDRTVFIVSAVQTETGVCFLGIFGKGILYVISSLTLYISRGAFPAEDTEQSSKLCSVSSVVMVYSSSLQREAVSLS